MFHKKWDILHTVYPVFLYYNYEWLAFSRVWRMNEIKTITIENEKYPERLKQIYDPPKCL